MHEYKIVKDIIRCLISSEQAEIYLFGSRATLTNRSNSDLDILIEEKNGGAIPSYVLELLHEKLEESNIPFKVDISLRSRITDDFFNKIKTNLKKF